MKRRVKITLSIMSIAIIVLLVMCLRLHRQREFLQYNIDRITGNCITRIAGNLSRYHMSELDSFFYNFVSNQNRTWYMQASELYPYSSYAEDPELSELLSCMGYVVGRLEQTDIGGSHPRAYLYEDIYNDRDLQSALKAYSTYPGDRESLQVALERLKEIVQLPSPEMRDNDAA